ncbi:hypothetical protein U1Q18_018208 [Sarracenia purpurea var. burkii]
MEGKILDLALYQIKLGKRKKDLGSEERVEVNEITFEEEELVSRVVETAKEDSFDCPKCSKNEDGQLDLRKKDREGSKAWLGGVLSQIRTLSNMDAVDIDMKSGATKKLREENRDTEEVDRQQERQQEGTVLGEDLVDEIRD